MATVTPTRAPAAKSEAFVEQQLARARRRIRLLDVTAALLGLAVFILVYAVGMILLDGRLELPSRVRQLAFLGLLLVGLAYVGVAVVRPLLRRINPYYAARQVEQFLDGAKNSVVNWLDLHGRPLPPAIHAAVTQRAAKDLARADLDTAISGRRAARLGGLAGVLLFVLFVQFVIGGRQFLSLFGRAFAPFVEASIKTRTQLVLLEPEAGDATVAVGRAVSFRAQVVGRIPSPDRPDAVRLLYRYHAADPYEEQRLERGDSDRDWVTTVPAFQVHNGFWYKLAGGDSETPEYRVRVRSTPLLTDFEVNYHFRPYLGWPDQGSRDPNLKAMRGTEVILVARANRAVKSAQLDLLDAKKSVPFEPVPGEPQAMRFRLVLDQDDTYRIWFLSAEGERNAEAMPYEIKVLRDAPPRVALAKPGEDTTLPANGVLQLKGSATDDFGVSGLKLHLQVSDQDVLLDKAYRDGKPLRLGDGSWPLALDYADFVELDKVKQAGKPLKPGMTLEYWLEATDNCDYPPPGPNVGRSEKFKLKLVEPQQEQQKQEQKKQAEQQRQNHEQKQDRDLQQQKKPQEGDGQKQDQSEQQPSSPEDKQVNDQKERLERAIEQQQKEQKPDQNQQPSQGDKGDQDNQAGKGPRQEKSSGVDQKDPGKQQKPDQGGQGNQSDKPSEGGGQPQKKDGAGEGSEKQSKPDVKPQGDQGDERQPQPGAESKDKAGEGGQNKPENKGRDKSPTKPESGNQPEKSGTEKGGGSQNNTGGKQPPPGGEPQRQQNTSPDNRPDQGADAKKPEAKKSDEGAGQGSENNGKREKPAKPDGKSTDPTGPGGEKKSPQNSGQDSGTADKNDQSPGAGQTQPKEPAKGRQKPDGKGDAGTDSNMQKDKAGGEATAERPEQKDKSGGENSQANPPDAALKDLVEKLKNADPQTRKDVADRLSKLRRETRNKETAEAIDKALKEARRQEAQGKPGDGSPPPQQPTGSPKSTDAGPAKGRTQGNKAEPKAGQNSDPGGQTEKNSDSGKPDQRPDPSGKPDPNRKEKGEGDGTVPGKQPRPAKPGEAPGNPTTGDRQGDGPAGNSDAPVEEGTAADPRFQKKAGDLQLEEFKKKVTKDVLRKANMTPAEYQRFLKAYEEMLKKQKDSPKANEKLTDPKRKGGVLPNQGARRVRGQESKDATQGSGPGTAPPEFLEAYREFTEKLSNIPPPRDKK